jgi:hypothetical protein
MVLQKLPSAITYGQERIIGERKVKNEDKILSLYEEDIHVYVRKKAGSLVEFGNKLLLGELASGLVVDWRLYKDKIPADATLLSESLDRFNNTYGKYPEAASTDRGFFSKNNQKLLERNCIGDYICPKAPLELQKRVKEEEFKKHQNRRSQTEARIAIFKNNFLGKPLCLFR